MFEEVLPQKWAKNWPENLVPTERLELFSGVAAFVCHAFA